MRKINLKRNSLGISSIAVISLLLFFSSGPLAHADLPDPDYYIGYTPLPEHRGIFDVQTRTYAGGAPQTHFWFTIRDANYYHAPPMESVVDSVTITDPLGIPQDFTPKLTAWCHTVRESMDDNPQDGIIDIFAGEWRTIAECGTEYEVIVPESTHVAGEYLLEVKCNNGQPLFASAHPAVDGMTAAELPPVANVTAGFNSDGLFQVSWDLPPGGYTPGPTPYIRVRIERYDKKRVKRYDQFNVRNLPNDQTSHTFFKWESDILRLYTGYIEVQIQTYSGWGNKAVSEVIEYKIKKLLK